MQLIFDIFNFQPLTFFKLFVILILTLYALFAFVLYRQERLMVETIEVPSSAVFSFLTFLHLILSIALLLFAIFLL